MARDSLLKFPCSFPIKIVGKREEGFAQEMVEIVLRHAPDFDPASVEMRPSSQGAYLALTCTLIARSQQQLDDLYAELSAHPKAKWVL